MPIIGSEAMEAQEPDEFQGLVVGELDSVYRLACHLARSRDEAEDLVQETYLRALKSRSTFRTSEHGARPWLFTILHNIYKMRQQRRQKEPAASDSIDDFAASPASSASAAESIDWEKVDERLKGAVDALPPAYRIVLLLWAVDGLKYREIARVIDAPVGTVMSRLHRARQAVIEHAGTLAAEQRYGRPSLHAGRRGTGAEGLGNDGQNVEGAVPGLGDVPITTRSEGAPPRGTASV